MEEKIEIKQVKKFGDVINDTFAFVRQNFKVMGKSLLYIAGPLIIVSAVTSGIHQSGVVQGMGQTIAGGANTAGNFNTFGITYFSSLIFSLLASLMITIITIESFKLYLDHGADYTVEMVWTETKKDFFMLFFTNIGIFFVILISMVFLIIPGIYFAIVVSILPIIRVQERTGFFKSLGRAMKLMGGNWWLTLGILFVFGIILMVLAVLVSIPQSALTFFVVFQGMQDLSGPVIQSLFILSSIIYSFVLIIYSIPTIGMYVHYFSLVEKKEGQGLLEKIEEI